MKEVHVLYNRQGKYMYQIAASADKQVLETIAKSIKKQPEIESLIIETYAVYQEPGQYFQKIIERNAVNAISGLYEKEKTAIMAYIEQLKAGQSKPCPVSINKEPYEQK